MSCFTRFAPRTYHDIYVLILQYVGIVSPTAAIRSWAIVVTSVGKARRHLPKAGMSSEWSWSRVWDVEGTSLAVLPTGSADGGSPRCCVVS